MLALPHTRARLVLPIALAALPLGTAGEVVINEILHDSAPNPAKDEFLELVNTGEDEVDLSGWRFSDGVDFVFPNGTALEAGGYLVVAEDPAAMASRHGVAALGPWGGALSKEGERVRLRDAAGAVADSVDYRDRFPWPVGAVGTGRSMELVNPALDNDLGGSWRASGTADDGAPSVTLLPARDNGWRYRKGTGEASVPTSAWRELGFVEDASWLPATTPLGYGDGDDTTLLTDMEDNYTTVYLRNTFNVAAGAIPAQLELRVYVDDGAVVWINGTEVGRFFVGGVSLAFNATATNHEAAWETMPLTNPAALLREGENIVAVHAINQAIGSSDFSIDVELKTPEPGAAQPRPTPGAPNSAAADNAPPQARQVAHAPKQPAAGEPAVITVKVTDPDGVAAVDLLYQTVAPGDYIQAFRAHATDTLLADPERERDPDPAFEDPANWTVLAMADDGAGADAVAADGVYTATVPGQPNRTLVRYRIRAEDGAGSAARFPYPDDPSLNFAYYSYDGVPDFVAGTRSVTGTVPTVHTAATLTSIPVYTLITDAADLSQCIAYSGGQIPRNNFEARSAFNWNGTFVYDGVVYDHIRYRLRQRNDRYGGGGKRSFRFRFNTGHHPRFRDLYGDPYPTRWRTLNTHKMSARGGPNFGLHETANSILWNLTGTPAPRTHWFHFRVVRGAEEAPGGADGQHLGDFFGLQLAIEDYDVRFLQANGLAPGNLYKLKSTKTNGKEVQRYQAADAVEDGSDYSNILNDLRPSRDEAWLRRHVDWASYFRYHAIVDAVRHYDVAPNLSEHLKNRSYYFAPDSADPSNVLGKLHVFPWDSDTSWGPNWNGGIDLCTDAVLTNGGKAAFVKEYRNTVREVRALVWQEDQIGALLDNLRDRIAPFVLADRDRWTGAPASAGSQSDGDMPAKVEDMKRFAFVGGSWTGGNDPADPNARDSGISGQQGRDAYLDGLGDDPAAPSRPTLSYTGPAGFPTDGLSFTASTYANPGGAGTFAAIQWRLAEITPYDGGLSTPNDVLLPLGSSWRYLDDGSDQGTAWRGDGFDDAGWAEGAGELGYGDGDEETEVGFGPDSGNKYFTTYFRTTFDLVDKAAYAGFLLRLRRDDGAVVYINDQEAGRSQMPAGAINFLTPAGGTSSNTDESALHPIQASPLLFREGSNTVAVEVHQQNGGSSDISFDLAIEGIVEGEDGGPAAPPRVKFEWEADWDSGMLTAGDETVEIPAAVARDGIVYRARVRHLDSTGRWSYWSEPVEFTAGPPSALDPLLEHLVITEVMYNPAPPTEAEAAAGFSDGDEFEFIEIYNASAATALDLTDVRFTKGIDFDFAPGTTLDPGAFLLVVRDRAAFEARYGDALPVAGEYRGNDENNLSNGGERLKLSFGAGTPVRDFDYDDAEPWPAGADGAGFSLVLTAPADRPDHADPTRWAAGTTPGGTPGRPKPAGATFAEWRASFGLDDPDPAADADRDGIPNFLEFAFGADPTRPSREGFPGAALDGPPGAARHLTITFQRPPAAAGLRYRPEFSPDLDTWVGGAERESATTAPDGTVTEVWRSPEPIAGGAGAALFVRVVVEE